MNIYRIIPHTKAEGPGNRFAIWTQGCSRHCAGCMLPETWSFAPNREIPAELILEQIAGGSDIEGITVLGGEPFEQPEELLAILKGVRKMGLSSIVFTGFTMSELTDKNALRTEILKNLDVLVDGAYIEQLRSFAVPMIGSSNQKFYFLTDRYTMNDIPPNRIEVRISEEGTIMYNGMGDFEKYLTGGSGHEI